MKRLAEAPNVPTLAEAGLANYSITADIGILAPKGTPPAIAQKLAAAAVSALKQPDVRKRFAELGIVPDGRVGAEYGAYIDKEVTRIGGILQRAGLAGSQ
jgi:tripartite-type tricarboxylate transporter receptor subunit TctC